MEYIAHGFMCSDVLDWHIAWQNEWLPSTHKVLPDKAQDESPPKNGALMRTHSISCRQCGLWTQGHREYRFLFFSKSFFKKNYFILEYRWLTMLWLFQMNSKGTQSYIYSYQFSPKQPSPPGCHITLNRVPCALDNRSLLVSILNIAVHTCLSQIPCLFPQPFPLATISWFSMSESVSVLFIVSFLFGFHV